ncbi:MAG: DnrO protein [Rhodanobacter sp.]
MNVSLLATAVVLSGLLMMPLAQALPPQHHDHEATSAVAIPVPTQRWTPDAPLREGMRRAQTAVVNLHRYESGQMTAAAAHDQAGAVVDAVSYMFAHCQLAAEPDAALHGILLPLLKSAQALQADPKDVHAITEMRETVAQYPRYFNDPTWNTPAPVQPSAHDHH